MTAFNPDHWWGRTIRATKGRTTPLGALLLAILGSKRGRPAWGDSAIIFNGNLIATHIDANGVIRPSQVVCTVDEFRTFLAELTVKCDLNDREFEELYRKSREYIKGDFDKGGTDLEGRYKAMEKGII